MWFTPETLARLQGNFSGSDVSSNDIQKRRDAEKAAEESSRGICSACAEEIVKNITLGHWESDFLLGYCYESKDRKHRPIVRYVPEEGVTNVERNDQTHSEPVSGEG